MLGFFERIGGKIKPGRQGGKAEHFVVIPALRIAFGRVPKAANSSIKAALARHIEIDPNCPVKPTRDLFWSDYTDGRTTMLSATDVAALKDYFVFAFTRDPFDRLASCYNNKIVESKSLPEGFARLGFDKSMCFDDFVRRVAAIDDAHADIHFQSQASMLTCDGYIVPAFIGRFENLADDWTVLDAMLRDHAGIDLGHLEKRNYRRGDTADLRDYYANNDIFALTRQRYAEDFRLFYPDARHPAYR